MLVYLVDCQVLELIAVWAETVIFWLCRCVVGVLRRHWYRVKVALLPRLAAFGYL